LPRFLFIRIWTKSRIVGYLTVSDLTVMKSWLILRIERMEKMSKKEMCKNCKFWLFDMEGPRCWPEIKSDMFCGEFVEKE